MILLKTKRLTVRAFEAADFEGLKTLMTDPDAMRFTGFKKPQSVERIQELLKKWQLEGRKQLGVWALECTDSKAFVGWIMLKPTNSETPELGYMLCQSQWGKGYASEASAAVLNYGLLTLKIPKVLAATAAENKASRRILEKIGMTLVHETQRDDGGVEYVVELNS